MSYPQTVVIWKKENIPGKDHPIYTRAPFWQAKAKEMHNFPILLSSYRIILRQSKNHKNKQISKLLKGTVWTTTDIPKKTMDTLCFSQHFLKSWAQATIIILHCLVFHDPTFSGAKKRYDPPASTFSQVFFKYSVPAGRLLLTSPSQDIGL